MTEQRYRYVSVGITEDREVPAVLLGKRNATFEIAGDEYERTALLKLPEKMNQTEFDTWKESGGIDLIDMYFHCIQQKSVRPEEPEDAGDDEQSELMTDGGSPSIPAEEIEHRCGSARKQLRILEEKVGEDWLSGYLVSAIEEIDEAEEMLKGEAPVASEGEPVPDGGSSMPPEALKMLKELKEVDDRLGDWLSEATGDDLDGFSEVYDTEHSSEDAGNDIQLGDGFAIKEAEFVELLGVLEHSRAAVADDPIVLGVRNRLLMQFILANPEEYARIKREEAERRKEAQEAARQQFNEAVGRQRMNERMAKLNDGVDIPIDGDAEGSSE